MNLGREGDPREPALNIRGEIDQFGEQDAALGQHPLDLIGRVRHRPRRGVNVQLRPNWWLIIIADPGECLQRPGARLGLVNLGVEALADFGRRRDIDLS